MAKPIHSLLPATTALLESLGERLRLARLRRKLTAKQVAERAGISTMTLRSLERGSSGATIGAYLAVMQTLGIEKDMNLLAQADNAGRTLQDADLLSGKRRRALKGSAGSGGFASIQDDAKKISSPSSAKSDSPSPKDSPQRGTVRAESLLRLLDIPTAKPHSGSRKR